MCIYCQCRGKSRKQIEKLLQVSFYVSGFYTVPHSPLPFSPLTYTLSGVCLLLAAKFYSDLRQKDLKNLVNVSHSPFSLLPFYSPRVLHHNCGNICPMPFRTVLILKCLPSPLLYTATGWSIPRLYERVGVVRVPCVSFSPVLTPSALPSSLPSLYHTQRLRTSFKLMCVCVVTSNPILSLFVRFITILKTCLPICF